MHTSVNMTFLKQHWKGLLTFVGIILFIQIIGAYATFQSVSTWYADLNKPFFTPPDWLFGPVWTMLYVMIAVSGWLLWPDFPDNYVERMRQPAIYYYFIQLVCNALWSPLFFGLRLPHAGMVVIFLMLPFIALTCYHAYKSNHRIVAYMLVPYFLWVSFASLLNLGIVLLN